MRFKTIRIEKAMHDRGWFIVDEDEGQYMYYRKDGTRKPWMDGQGFKKNVDLVYYKTKKEAQAALDIYLNCNNPGEIK